MLNQDETRTLAHLLRRAGFGARPDEWAAYAKLGVAGTTDRLLHPEAVPDHLAEVMQDIGADYIDFTDMGSVSKWWMYRMLHTQRPLEEKMTLFWHGHFATANYKVDNPRWMWQQNQTFRTHALGNFRQMLLAVTRDPAMLVWLDGVDNRKGHPNENYGRELQELFTMGVGSGYTEKDVQEAARAFTGWGVDRDANSAVFSPDRHDDGVKTYLGETGNFTGDDVIDIIVRQPATARFLSHQAVQVLRPRRPLARRHQAADGRLLRQRVRDPGRRRRPPEVAGVLQPAGDVRPDQKPGGVRRDADADAGRADDGDGGDHGAVCGRWGRNCSTRPTSRAGRAARPG